MPHLTRDSLRASARTAGVLGLLGLVLTAGAPGVIRISRGDTLSGLAHRHHTTVRALMDLNHLQGNATIYAGALLKIPAVPPVRHTYVVRPGDNLTTIARRLHTDVASLRSHNAIRGDLVRIGQRLTYFTAGTPASTTVAPAPRASVRGPVAAAAARDRAALAARHLPSRATVRAMIVSAALRHGVAPDLALAVAYQESGFQQRVVSPVDAVGVMQVLPSTARSLGAAHGRPFDVLKASDNVEAGVLLLGDLVRATGTWQGALAGYYQGLGSVAAKGLLPQTHAYIRSVGFLRQRFS